MKSTLFFALVSVTVPFWGQTSNGVSTEWDLRKTLDSLNEQSKRLQPILEQLTPQEWVEKGAPDTYVTQWKLAQNELRYLLGASQNFAKQPERMPLALETYFRLEAMESTLGSLTEAVRKYQNPAVADLMQSTINENGNNRQHLRQYISDLASTKEQELKVMDQEAQRCRGMLTRQPPPAHPPAKKQEQP